MRPKVEMERGIEKKNNGEQDWDEPIHIKQAA